MKCGFYPKLAFDGIRKNKRLYIPYILTCIGMVVMYYIIVFLQGSASLLPKGVRTVTMILNLGGWVIAVFSALFLFYTNSFLIRRRKKEFGLYNVLGMSRINLIRISVWETIIISLISLFIGLGLGIILSKLAELCMINILKSEVNFTLSVSVHSVVMTLLVFGVIFIALLLNSIRHIVMSTATSLMNSENAGEKPPKANIVLGVLGLIILAAAYYIAVTTKNPLSAMLMFFIAVIMVIIGTYIVMITGSVLFCRILQKKKTYYYKSNHFVSVSSMVYRMKRNGAGLASICILLTMVLVMISSTTCIYFGIDDIVDTNCPSDINVVLGTGDITFLESKGREVSNFLDDAVKEHKAKDANSCSYVYILSEVSAENNMIFLNDNSFDNSVLLFFYNLSDYNKYTGSSETLKDNEVLLFSSQNSFNYDTIAFSDGTEFVIKNRVGSIMKSTQTTFGILPSISVVTADFDCIESVLYGIFKDNPRYYWAYYLDTDLDSNEQQLIVEELFNSKNLVNLDDNEGKEFSYSVNIRQRVYDDYYGVFGGLFFLGIVLSIVFIMAAIMIIYYKQISEGYEDQSRFEIMQKVGMTDKEIKKSINSQVLTMFFLPLIAAGSHLSFSFPIISKILNVFSMNNITLFATTTLSCFAVIALLYSLVYKQTSKAYYNIVRGSSGDRS